MKTKTYAFVLGMIAAVLAVSFAFSETLQTTIEEAKQEYFKNSEAQREMLLRHREYFQDQLTGTGLPETAAAVIDDSVSQPLWVTDIWNGRLLKLYDIDGDGVADALVVFARGISGIDDLFLISPYQIIASNIWGGVYLLGDNDRNGIADDFYHEFTPLGGDSLVSIGAEYFLSGYHPSGVMMPFRITDEGIAMSRKSIIYGAANLAAMAFNSKRELFGVNAWYGVLIKVNPASPVAKFGYTEWQAQFGSGRYPVGLTFDEQNRAVVLFASQRFISDGKEAYRPGTIALVEPSADVFKPRVTNLSESAALLSAIGGVAAQTNRRGGLRIFSVENSFDFPSQVMLHEDLDGNGTIDRKTIFLPPELSGSRLLGSVAAKKFPPVLY